jgi:hypothetical protein
VLAVRVIASAASNLAIRFTPVDVIRFGDHWLLKMSRFARHDKKGDGVLRHDRKGDRALCSRCSGSVTSRVIASAASNLAIRFTPVDVIGFGDHWLLKMSRFARHDKKGDGVLRHDRKGDRALCSRCSGSVTSRVIASAASNLALRFTPVDVIGFGDHWLLKMSRFARHDKKGDGVLRHDRKGNGALCSRFVSLRAQRAILLSGSRRLNSKEARANGTNYIYGRMGTILS